MKKNLLSIEVVKEVIGRELEIVSFKTDKALYDIARAETKTQKAIARDDLSHTHAEDAILRKLEFILSDIAKNQSEAD